QVEIQVTAMRKVNEGPRTSLPIRKLSVSVCVIFLLSLSTFDGFGVDGLVPLIQRHYTINDAETAIIKTSASISQTIMLTLVWIFGDSFKRRRLFLISAAIWIALSLMSILLGTQSFMIFVIIRSLGIAAAGVFEVLAPVILADLFADRALGVALTCLSVAELASSQLSAIVTSWIVSSHISWQWGLLVAPLIAIGLLLYLVYAKSAIRNVERSNHGIGGILRGAFGVLSIKSYLLLTVAGSFEMFSKKAYIFWFPTMLLVVWENVPDLFFGLSYTTITALRSFTMLAGTLAGLPIVLWIAQSWRHGTGCLFSGRSEYLRAYPIVVSVGVSLYGAMLFMSFIVLDSSFLVSQVATFLTGFGGAADSCLSQLMLLMAVPSSYRAAAVALRRLVARAVSIPSAQLVGAIADASRGDSTLPFDRFRAYELGLLCSSSLLVAGPLCFIVLIYFFPGDYKRAIEIDEHEVAEETTFLIEKRKMHSESIVDSVLRSRAAM
ncbi:hypothetical protein PENTCL1PPCAC_8114, partial [Pristionchus entomophagus]